MNGADFGRLDFWTIVVLVLLILLSTIFLAWFVRKSFGRFIERSAGEIRTDPTNYKFMQHLIIAAIYLTGFSFAIYLIPGLSHIAGSMIAGAGILAVAVGFASQQALGNLVSGLLIVIYKPYRIHDRITIRSTLQGVVEDISLRHTVIRNSTNQRIIIPNAVMGNEVLLNSSYMDHTICRFLEVSIRHLSDRERVRRMISEEVTNHPDYYDVRTTDVQKSDAPRVRIRMIQADASSIVLRAWIWAADVSTSVRMGHDLLEAITVKLEAEGIEFVSVKFLPELHDMP